jgi:hypothetical protein
MKKYHPAKNDLRISAKDFLRFRPSHSSSPEERVVKFLEFLCEATKVKLYELTDDGLETCAHIIAGHAVRRAAEAAKNRDLGEITAWVALLRDFTERSPEELERYAPKNRAKVRR